MIPIDDFKKVEMKIGKILSAERVPETDKLLKLSVDFGEEAPRQVVSGIAAYYPDPHDLIGRKFPFVTNLEPRQIRGLESQAMILAAGSDTSFSLLAPLTDIPPGTSLR